MSETVASDGTASPLDIEELARPVEPMRAGSACAGHDHEAETPLRAIEKLRVMGGEFTAAARFGAPVRSRALSLRAVRRSRVPEVKP